MGDILYITFTLSGDGSLSVASLCDSFHVPYGSHLKSIRYYFIFFSLTCPPDALASPGKTFNPFCTSLTVSIWGVSGVGATYIIVESSTKQYLTIWKESREMINLKDTPYPASLRQFRKGELMMLHIYGAAPFPWLNPCGGGLSGISHMSPLHVISESPKTVLAKCTIFYRVVNVQWIGSLGVLTL